MNEKIITSEIHRDIEFSFATYEAINVFRHAYWNHLRESIKENSTPDSPEIFLYNYQGEISKIAAVHDTEKHFRAALAGKTLYKEMGEDLKDRLDNPEQFLKETE